MALTSTLTSFASFPFNKTHTNANTNPNTNNTNIDSSIK
jgi:hypothetical protein